VSEIEITLSTRGMGRDRTLLKFTFFPASLDWLMANALFPAASQNASSSIVRGAERMSPISQKSRRALTVQNDDL